MNTSSKPKQGALRPATRISILMGVFNAAPTLTSAVECIIRQTFQNWELIICDDGSSDSSREIALLLAAADERIHVLRNTRNLGLAPTLNKCAAASRGEYLARMDADDLCSPRRLAKQLEFLTSNPSVAFVSTAVQYFDRVTWGISHPIARPSPKDFLRGNPFAHGAVMMRRTCFDAAGGYSESPDHWRVEDYELWARMYQLGFQGYNLPAPLYGLRNDAAAIARRNRRARFNEARLVLQIGAQFGLTRRSALAAARPFALGILPPQVYSIAYRRKHRAPGARDYPQVQDEGLPAHNRWVDSGRSNRGPQNA